MQHKSQLLPMSSGWRCAGEAAAVPMASTVHAHASNSQPFHKRLWHMSYHDINKFGRWNRAGVLFNSDPDPTA